MSEQVLTAGVKKLALLEYSQIGKEMSVVDQELLDVGLSEPVGEHVEAAGVVGDDS